MSASPDALPPPSLLPSPFPERKVAFLLAVLAAIVSSFPTYYGAAHIVEGHSFLWSSYPFDTNHYFAIMRVGYRGDWLYSNLVTPETNPPVLLFPFFVWLGKLAALYRDLLTAVRGEAPGALATIPIVYHQARFVFTLLFYAAFAALARRCIPARPQRLWAVAIAILGAGVLLRSTNHLESHLLLSCAMYPNFAASLLLMAVGLLAYFGAFKLDAARPGLSDAPGRTRLPVRLAAAAISGLGLAWIHPFDLPAMGMIALLCGVALWVQRRRFPARFFCTALTFVLAAAAAAAQQALILHRLPDFRSMNDSNIMKWRSPLEILELFELLLLLGLAGIPALWRNRRRPESLFLLGWLAAALLTLALPFPFQRRTMEGLPMILVLSATCAVRLGVLGLVARRQRHPVSPSRGSQALSPAALHPGARAYRRAAHFAYAALLLVLLPRTLKLLYAHGPELFDKPTDLYYVSDADVAAGHWLHNNTQWTDTVWASLDRGNRLPLLAGNRVVFGHSPATVNYPRKIDETRRFMLFEMPVTEFRQRCADYGVRYIYWSSHEQRRVPPHRNPHTYDPETVGPPVYHEFGVAIYPVRPPVRSRNTS